MNDNSLPTAKSPDTTSPTYAPHPPPIVLWIGLDWADQKHHLVGLPTAGGPRLEQELAQKPELLEAAILEIRRQHPTGRIGVCVEQSRGPVIAALLKYDFLHIYPINPRCLADYRRVFTVSGAKSDPRDADLLADLGLKHSDRFHPLHPRIPSPANWRSSAKRVAALSMTAPRWSIAWVPPSRATTPWPCS
jgi:hypothetical protein